MIVRCNYVGTEPLSGENDQGFFIGSIPVVEPAFKRTGDDIQFNRLTPKLVPHAILIRGGFDLVIIRDGLVMEGYAWSVRPNTGVLLKRVVPEAFEELKKLDNWKVRVPMFNEYCHVLETLAWNHSQKAEALARQAEAAWLDYYDLDQQLADTDTEAVVRVDCHFGKQPKDAECPSTERFHYHVNCRVKNLQPVIEAIEAIEEAFDLLKTDCEVRVAYNGDQIYPAKRK
jgi:hypothetical protein